MTGGGPGDYARDIDEYIRGIEPIPVEDPKVVEGETSQGDRQGAYVCYRQPVEETRQYDELVAYNGNSEALWPGALVGGQSIASGQLKQLVFDREPATVSISLANLDGTRSAVLEEPSLSSFRDAIGGVLANDVTGATPANIYAEIEQVHSSEQLAMAIGTSVSGIGLPGSVAASFDFKNKDVRSRYVVKYTQSYYTVDLDQPATPGDVFADSVSLADVQRRVPPGSPPAYVSSVTYGRVILFTFESAYSAQELGSALEFTYNGGVDVSGDVSLTYEEMVSRSDITAYILGGSGGDAARSLESYDELMAFIHSGGDYSKDSPGAPIAYKLAYLKDNSPVRMSYTRDYEITSCERVSQKVRVTLNKLRVDDGGGDDSLQIYGNVAASSGSGEQTLLAKDAGDAIDIRVGTAWPEGEPLAEAIVDVDPEEGSTIVLEADLTDKDPNIFSGDDDLGREIVELPFETGWRRDTSILLTGDGAKVAAEISVRPI